MTLTIGRFETPDCPAEARRSGDRLSLAIDLRPGSLGIAQVWSQQLLGLVDNNDEPVVPVTWTNDSSVDGFYRVLGVGVEPLRRSFLRDGRMSVAVDLERVGGGYANPAMELQWVAADGGGGYSFTLGFPGCTGEFAAYFPASWRHQAETAGLVPEPLSGRTASDGSTFFRVASDSLSAATTQVDVVTLQAGTDEYYDGACTVEALSGGTWSTVIGRQIPSDTPIRVSNGVVRGTFDTANGRLDVESYDGTAWRLKQYTLLGYQNAAELVGGIPESWTVVRNSPEASTISAQVRWGTKYFADYTLTVQRGVALLHLALTANARSALRITRSTAEAATTLVDDVAAVYAIEATAADANGHKYVIASYPEVAATDTVNGGMDFDTSVSTVKGRFAIGLELSGAAAPNTSERMAQEYPIPVSLHQTVVAR